MLVSNGRNPKVERNYHITTEELKLLFEYSRRYSSKFQLLIALCAFRGLRVSEALAINILDFSDTTFTKLTYREAKTNKMQHNKPIIQPLAEMIKAYVVTNSHRLSDGYLFPYHNKKQKRPYLRTEVIGAWMAKLRNLVGKDHPAFLEGYTVKAESGKTLYRYRIGFHSFRRWFETHLHDSTNDVYTVKEVMSYADFAPLNAYLNRSRVLQREGEILHKAFTPLLQELSSQEPGTNGNPS